jgi:hypothetical protein
MDEGNMRIVVHTKSGKKLKYTSAFYDERSAKDWWMDSLHTADEVVSFSGYVIKASDIDFVEIIR